MKTEQRILKTQANDVERPPDRFKQRDRDRHERILRVCMPLLATNGRAAVTANSLAVALDIPGTTFRRHFVDVDELLGVLLTRHLRDLAKAIGSIEQDAADMPKARRAAYVAYTHTHFGALTPIHRILVIDRHFLPPDVGEAIEATIHGLSLLLAGPKSDYALQIINLVDSPGLNAAMVEAMIATLPAEATAVVVAPLVQAVKPLFWNHDPYAGMRPDPGNPPNTLVTPSGPLILESLSEPYNRQQANGPP